MCGFHQGEKVSELSDNAVYMSATGSSLVFASHHLAKGSGPYMLGRPDLFRRAAVSRHGGRGEGERYGIHMSLQRLRNDENEPV
jgi:hypothetical protein